MLKFMLLSFWLVLASCEKNTPPGTSGIFLEARKMAQLTEEKLGEVSGLAASASNPGFLWAHNDSGNPAVVYLVDEKLNIRLSCRLKGVKNRDWEDIAVGPGPDPERRYLYVADIGDNNARHDVKYIYRFEEPALREGTTEITISSFDIIAFRLADGKKDTEAIMVHPRTKNIYVVSKREKPVYLYELTYPFSGDKAILTAEKIAPLPLTQIVSAGISADGQEVLMKNYDNIYYWTIDDKPLAEVLKQKPERLKYTEEPQGEAITFNRDGSGFYTLSEKIVGEDIFLYFYEKRK